MPKSSFADQIQDWEKLLQAVRCSEAELAGLAPFREAFERAYALAVSTRARRDALRIATMEATRQINAEFAACREAASALRSYVKSVLGFRSEALLLYGVRPIRKRRPAARSPGSCRALSR